MSAGAGFKPPFVFVSLGCCRISESERQNKSFSRPSAARWQIRLFKDSVPLQVIYVSAPIDFSWLSRTQNGGSCTECLLLNPQHSLWVTKRSLHVRHHNHRGAKNRAPYSLQSSVELLLFSYLAQQSRKPLCFDINGQPAFPQWRSAAWVKSSCLCSMCAHALTGEKFTFSSPDVTKINYVSLSSVAEDGTFPLIITLIIITTPLFFLLSMKSWLFIQDGDVFTHRTGQLLYLK